MEEGGWKKKKRDLLPVPTRVVEPCAALLVVVPVLDTLVVPLGATAAAARPKKPVTAVAKKVAVRMLDN